MGYVHNMFHNYDHGRDNFLNHPVYPVDQGFTISLVYTGVFTVIYTIVNADVSVLFVLKLTYKSLTDIICESGPAYHVDCRYIIRCILTKWFTVYYTHSCNDS